MITAGRDAGCLGQVAGQEAAGWDSPPLTVQLLRDESFGDKPSEGAVVAGSNLCFEMPGVAFNAFKFFLMCQ